MEKFCQRNCAVSASFTQFIFNVIIRRHAGHGTLRSLTMVIVFCLWGNVGWGQVSISAGNPVTENFTIGNSANANLPSAWKIDKNTSVRRVGDYSTAVLTTELSAANSIGTSATNGIYNFGGGVDNNSIDRAVGGLSSGGASKSVNVYVCLRNDATFIIDNFIISYNVEKYRNGSNSGGFSIQMYYSMDGITWASAGDDFLTRFAVDIDNIGFSTAPGTIVNVTNKILSVSVNAGSNLYLAWNYSVSSGSTTSNAQALAIDDVSITAAFADYFRSKVANGNWPSSSSWESSADNIDWSAATSIPTSSAKGITIRNSHTITLTGAATAKGLTIEAGGILTNTNIAGGYLLSIDDDGTTAPDFNIYGTYILFGTAPEFNNGSTVVIYNNALVRADDNNGGDSEGFASSTSVLFKTGSVFEWNTNTAFSTDEITYFPTSVIDIPIFRISKFVSPLGTTKYTTFNGILEVNSNISFINNGIKTFRDGLSGIATLTLEASTGGYYITSSSAILAGTIKLILNNNLHLTNGVTVPSDANVTVTQYDGKGFLKGEGSFKVDGIIDISDVTISNTNGNVTVNGTLKTSKENGLCNPGNIASGNININTGSTIEYNALVNQSITSTAILGQPYYNITFSGSGTKTPNSAINVNELGTVKITGTSVIVDATSFNLGLPTTNATNFTMDGGRLILGTGGTQPNMDGAYNITGGVVEFKGNSAKTIRSKTYQNIEVTGNNVGNSSGNITLNNGGSFTVKPTGVFSINDNSIFGPTGTQTVTVESGGVFKCGNNKGFNGFPPTLNDNSSINPNIETIILANGSTVEYTKLSDQSITNANGLVYSNLTISGSGNKTAQAGTLTVQGNLTKSGTANFVHNGGMVILNGTSVQTYTCNDPLMIFNNLINNNTAGVNVNYDMGVYKELLLAANSKTILNAGNIHLKSDNNNTANVAPIPADATITYNTTGRFIVERYIPNHFKAWQFLAAPTKGSSVKAAWQEGNAAGGNTKPGYGTQITSNLPNPITLGFDLSSISPSMKTYDPGTNSWGSIPNTSINIENPKGYMLFVRGDRSVTTYNQSATATILRTTGKLYAPGSEAPSSITVPANSFQSIGNPYASAIDFSKLALAGGVESVYYIWDPQLTTGLNSAYGYGGYRTISGNAVVPSGGNYPYDNIPKIQSGQAFFVHATSEGTVSFSENSKVTGSASIFRPTKDFTEPTAQLRGNLYVANNNEPILIDGILTQFDASYSNELDTWDAIKISNSGENMGITSKGEKLSIERRQMADVNDTLFYNLEQMKQQQYQFEFIGTRLDQYGMEAFLEDNYLHTKTLLNLTGSTLINLNNTGSSWNRDRFHIVFSPAAGPVPVTFISVKVYQQNANIAVEWKVENESHISNYSVEKSADGNRFISSNTQDAKNLPTSNYNWIDAQPFDGYTYYRIKSAGINGEEKYSQVVRVYMGKGKPSISVYPNPLVDGIINLQFINQPAGNYKVRLLNSLNQLMVSKEIIYGGGSSSQTIPFSKYAMHGVYHLEVITPGGKKNVMRINY